MFKIFRTIHHHHHLEDHAFQGLQANHKQILAVLHRVERRLVRIESYLMQHDTEARTLDLKVGPITEQPRE